MRTAKTGTEPERILSEYPLDWGRIALALVEWYRRVARDLPWRRTAEPYLVWVSEIMLQQTRVEAVKPYFARFVARLPGLGDLAACDEEELLKLWEGLGYYSRARNLRAAARQMCGTGFPKRFSDLLKCKGIGPYTAAAVASIAFGEPVSAVDGNVLRVVSRLCCLEEDVDDPRVRSAVFSLLTSVMPSRLGLVTESTTPFGLPRNDAGDFNQAFMELGATVCLPGGAPLCGRCPLSELCRGNLSGAAQSFPLRAAKRARRIEQRTLLLLCLDGKYALRKRPGKGLLAGLWEFPSENGRLTPEQVRSKFGGTVTDAGEAKHVFTHLEWHMQGYFVELESLPADETLVFATREELAERFAIPSAFEAFQKKL